MRFRLQIPWRMLAVFAGMGLPGAGLALLSRGLFTGGQIIFHSPVEFPGFWGLAALTAGCVAVTGWRFHHDRRLNSRSAGMSLLLRLGLILAVWLVLLEPAWESSSPPTIRPRIALAFDFSDSMNAVDRQATLLEKMRWAEAIGLFAGEISQHRAARWRPQLQTGQTRGQILGQTRGQTLQWIASDESLTTETARQQSQAREDNLNRLLEQLADSCRLDILLQACRAQWSDQLEHLASQRDLHLFGFADASIPLQPEELFSDRRHFPGLDRSQTHLSRALQSAAQSLDTPPWAAAVLFSDGHDTSHTDSRPLLETFQTLKIPVHTVLTGSREPPRDLSIVSVDAPQTVLRNDRPLIKVTLGTAGLKETSLTVFLQSLDQPESPRLRQTAHISGPSTSVEFLLDELPVGPHRFRIWTDTAPRETRDDNNSADIAISVLEDRVRVLIIAGESSWEFRALQATLASDLQISLDSVLFEPPSLGIAPAAQFPARIEDLPNGPAESGPLTPYDLVIVEGTAPRHLTARHWEWLDRYVRQSAGTLVLTAGHDRLPINGPPLAVGLLPVRNVQPVEVPASRQTGPLDSRGFQIALSETAIRLPMFRLGETPEASRQVWESLPGQTWGLTGELRGGASCWASPRQTEPGKQADSPQANCLIAHQYAGAGQVVWLGLDSTWRWKPRTENRPHDRFWRQLVRWGAAWRSNATTQPAQLILRNPLMTADRPAHILVRFHAELASRLSAKSPSESPCIVITPDDSGAGTASPVHTPSPVRTDAAVRPIQTIPLALPRDHSLWCEVTASGLSPGNYSVSLQWPPGISLDLPAIPLVVRPAVREEQLDRQAHPWLLEQIAAVTGGTFLELNELYRLADLLPGTALPVRRQVPLFDGWIGLLLICSLATAEWMLRKQHGLP